MASPFLQYTKLVELASDGGYAQNTALSQLTAVFLLSALLYLQERWLWQGANDYISDAEYDDILDMITNAKYELMRNVMLGQIIETVAVLDSTDGFILMDGTSVLIADYPDLANVVPVAWLVGADIIIPDMTQKGTFGASGMIDAGQETGSNSVTLVTAQIPSHNHSQNPHTHSTIIPLVTPVGAVPVPPTPNVVIGTPAVTGLATATNNPAGGGQSHDNIQESLLVNFYIVAR